MMTIDELNNSIGQYVILENILSTIPEVSSYQRTREIRILEGIHEERNGVKYLIFGRGVVVDMKTRFVYAGREFSVPCPVSMAYRKAGNDIVGIIENYFKNRHYFINGKVI